MSSQEEYLDQLLKGLEDGDRAQVDAPGNSDADFSSDESDAEEKESYHIDDVKGMGIEDIERILEENERAAKEGREDLENQDLVEILDHFDESGIQEIRDYIVKSDRNEAVDERIINMIETAKESSEELPKDLLEQMQEQAEEEEEQEAPSGFLGKLFGKKKKNGKQDKKKKNERKKAEEFEYEMIELFGNMELIDGDEENKGTLDRLKDKLKAKKAARQELKEIREKEKQEATSKSGEDQKKKKKKRNNSLEEALDEIASLPGEAEEEQEPQLQNPESFVEFTSDDDSEGGALDLGLPQELFGDADTVSVDGDAQDLDELLSIADKDADKGEKGKKDGKKKGLFAKLFEFLTEEDEDEKQESSELILSDENDAILKELDKEGGKKKKKKPKKGKGKDEAAEGEDEEIPVKKEKKPKKPKKVKEPKTVAVEGPEKKLSKRRVQLIFLVCIALGAAFYVLSLVTVEFSEKKKASAAFQEGNYEECYQNLIGKNLNESEQVMFGKSESILRIRLWMKEYEMLAENGQEAEALDSLMQSVHDYPTLYAFSGKWNAVSEVQAVFDQMVDILNSKYGLTEEEAKIIANEEDDLLYSKMVRAIASGGSFGDWEEPSGDGEPADAEQSEHEEQSQQERNEDQDLLPEEEGLSDTLFAD